MPYNTIIVLVGTGVLGVVSGIIGSFAVLRRRALMGDALAHAALPGICLAFLVVGERSLTAFLVGAMITGTLGVLTVSLLRHATRIKEDAAIGMVLSVFFGGGIALSRIIQNMPSGNRAGLDSYIFGKTAGIIFNDVVLITSAALLVLGIAMVLYKEFRLLSFDREFAASQGQPVFALDVLMMGLLVVVTVVGLPAVGVVLMAAMLIIPGAAARFWTERLAVMLLLAGVFGGLTGVFGTLASARYSELPAGPVIVLVGTAIFIISMTLAPRRGVVFRLLSRHRLSRRTNRQNLLRTMYEIAERGGDNESTCSPVDLCQRRAWSERRARTMLRKAVRGRLVEPRGEDRFALTPRGLREATKVVRTHRLWEVFLIEQAHLAADRVDRDADSIEHVLGEDTVRRLEQRLIELGRWPKDAQLPPPSPHELRPVSERTL